MEKFNRVKLLLGNENLNKLARSSVAVFGIGGVGGYAAEALVRSGIGAISLFDSDTVSSSNINRQIIATVNSVGQDKVEVMKQRLLSINPDLKVNAYKIFYLPDNAQNFPLKQYDYVIDAVDTVAAKIEIIQRSKNANVPVITCMGTGGKLDVTALRVADVEKTKGCPLARVMRRELKNRGIKGVKAVYSEEPTIIAEQEIENAEKRSNGRTAPPSMIFVPAAAGLILAKEVITDLIKEK